MKWYHWAIIAAVSLGIIWYFSVYRPAQKVGGKSAVSFDEFKDKMDENAYRKLRLQCESYNYSTPETNLCTRSAVEGYLMVMNSIPQSKL